MAQFGQDTADADADTQNFDLRTGQVSATPLGAVIIATIVASNAAALTIRCENSRRVDDDELCRVYLLVVFVDGPRIRSAGNGEMAYFL